MISMVDTMEEDTLVEPMKERLSVEALVAAIINFNGDGINVYDDMVGALIWRVSYSYASKKLNLDLKNRATPPARPSIEKPPVLK